MKKISITLLSFLLVFSLTSCNNESLQSYIVKSQEKKGFITFDLPASFLQLKSDNVSQETKDALASLKKINLVALPFQNNLEALELEKKTIEAILKQSSYKSLMRTKMKGIEVSLYYTGSEDAIDEVIAYGYKADQGVAVARILGDDMNPALIMKMMNDVRMNGDGLDLEKFNVLFSSINKK
ncbi:hypothetical protein GCM10011416_15850 [Polaribacter pacificus]|uniref:DUF4252 domain-containing protein n=1 Tax=Polaribacter pacificus TaxID=1775173 RepID=A0A917HYZ2_9FLAO|nr:DUF4252 domain-containing protein [Polaribacter pacificus]GGG98525.1 hypothetical protein GCM10011416_15850 [Polaribacter pacificus]